MYALVNKTNVKVLTKDLLEYLKTSDSDFKGFLTAKICSIVEKEINFNIPYEDWNVFNLLINFHAVLASRFSHDKIWYIDQMIEVLAEVFSWH